MNELAGMERRDLWLTILGYFVRILPTDLRRFAAILGCNFARSRREKILRRRARGPSARRPESVTMVRLDGRLAQRLEHPAYTGKVRGSNP